MVFFSRIFDQESCSLSSSKFTKYCVNNSNKHKKSFSQVVHFKNLLFLSVQFLIEKISMLKIHKMVQYIFFIKHMLTLDNVKLRNSNVNDEIMTNTRYTWRKQSNYFRDVIKKLKINCYVETHSIKPTWSLNRNINLRVQAFEKILPTSALSASLDYVDYTGCDFAFLADYVDCAYLVFLDPEFSGLRSNLDTEKRDTNEANIFNANRVQDRPRCSKSVN